MKIPYYHYHCIADKTQCPLADRCLRHVSWELVAREPSDDPSLRVVNQFRPDIHFATTACTKFIECRMERYARGMVKLYDNVPGHLHTWVRSHVMKVFPSQRSYFYYRLGRYPITPVMQQKIAKIFKKLELKVEPVFDEYYYDYNWE